MRITAKHIRYFLVFGQIVIWILIIAAGAESQSHRDMGIEPVLFVLWLCIPIITVINFNWYFLAPRFLKKGAYKKYFLYLAGCIIFCSIVLSLNSTIMENPDAWLIISRTEKRILIPKLLILIYGLTMVYILTMPFYLSFGWFDQRKQIEQLETEHLRTELERLKGQINPHFFFNTLNNLYSLILTNSGQAADAMLKLSEMMRYVIYDASKSSVSIQEELDYLNAYFDLQKMRLGTKAEVSFDHKVDDPFTRVVPLLFINILENAFKHGVDSMVKKAFVACQLNLSKNRLAFHVKNSHEKKGAEHKGLGLGNLRRRLTLLYPDSHRLEIKDENGIFEVSLTIEKVNELHDN